jgi:acetyl-CoA carboxylase biotin carboxyl carrier protein
MTPDDLHGYLALFRDSDWRQLTVTDGSGSLHVRRATAQAAEAAGAAAAPPLVVRSPSVGLLRLTGHATASGNATTAGQSAPAEGEHVTAGSWLADVIVADRVEPVLSPAEGTTTEWLASDGDPVEYNQPIIVIQP